ncbi:MAG: SM-like, degradation of cytoplasmic mRNAs and positively regulates transcription initiation [Watsoniomyces obsoletus]|nr:MAG: SM-like, degradation of cytoplasmic mRNAs and positively regulates transcription initiation [Watsoniomyces obsoletus]
MRRSNRWSHALPDSLDTTRFKPSKDQRQTLHRWNRYVLGIDCIRQAKIRYPQTREDKRRRRNQFDLAESVHDCEYSQRRRPPEPDHRFEVTLERDDFTEEKYALFENYQRNVHKEPSSAVSRGGFRRFLCSSPLHNSVVTQDGVEQRLGSYHQCYRLDGELVAMGVLDLLPQCVSAIYFIYNQEMTPWAFGKIGALREALLAMEGNYRYYYMGYYIHSCPKMRYKRDYKTQDVLDPETFDWDPLDDDFLQRLDTQKYVCLSRERRLRENAADAQLSNQPGSSDGVAHETVNPIQEDISMKDDNEDYDSKKWRSLFGVGMPGIMTVEELLERVDLDNIPVKSGRHMSEAQNYSAWDDGMIDDSSPSLKGVVAELAAAVGPTVANGLIVSV